MNATMRNAAFLLGCLLVFTPIASAQTEFKNFREALNEGTKKYQAEEYELAAAAFETAFKLADDDRDKIRAADSIMLAARQLRDMDRFVNAANFTLSKPPSDAKRSITRRALIAYAYQNGKLNDLIDQLEGRLKQNEDDAAAMYVLSEVYARIKPNPERALALSNRLAEIENREDAPIDVGAKARIAQALARMGKYEQAAEIYETIAPADPALAAWHFKEAASAWLECKQPDKAIAAAKASSESKGEERSPLLTHFWHAQLGVIFLNAKEPALAIPHLQKAIESTDNPGYQKTCQANLDAAIKAAGQR